MFEQSQNACRRLDKCTLSIGILLSRVSPLQVRCVSDQASTRQQQKEFSASQESSSQFLYKHIRDTFKWSTSMQRRTIQRFYSVIIRPSKTNDIASVAQIEMASFPTEQKPIPYQEFLVYHAQQRLLVAEEKTSEITGYLLFQRQHQEHSAVLLSMAVEPKRRSHGIGNLLVQHFAHQMLVQEGMRFLELEVHVNNTHAIQMYSKLGFFIQQRLRDYYEPGQDAFQMIKR